MRKQFSGFYPPTGEELAGLWDDGLVVLDTNALLNLYRYSDTTSSEFLEVLRILGNRLWIPYQVAFEFQRRRLDVIAEQVKAIPMTSCLLSIRLKSSSKVRSCDTRRMNRFTRPRSLPDSPLLLNLCAVDIETSRSRHTSNAPKEAHDDPLWDSITAIYEGRVGEKF